MTRSHQEAVLRLERQRRNYFRVAMFFFGVAVLLVAFAARGQEPPTRAFGGCSRSGMLCAGPSVVAGLVTYSFKSREFTTGVMAGACYGAQAWANRWHSVGVDLCVNIQTGGSQPTTGMFTAPFSFAEYLRIGPGVRVIGSEREWMLVGALGVNFK